MPQYNIKQVKGSTQGSILFLGNNGVVSENNSQLFWSPTQSSLSIGTTTFVSGEKLRILGNQRIDGNLIVSGSFSVLGSASIINTQNLTIQDPIILLASTQSGAPTLDSGLFINRGTGATQAFIWDESDSKFVVIQTNDGANAIGNVNISSGAQIRALRYNFFDSGSPAAAASATINAPSGGSIALNAASSVQFITPQLASSAQVTSWDIGANTLEFGGSNTRSFKLGVADSAGTTPTFMFYSTSAGNSGTVRTGMSFSHVVGSQFANVLERGFVIETRDGGTYSGTAVGLTIDVTGVTNSNRFKYGLRILDGKQSNGYVLVSDSNGFASWTSSSVVLVNANGVTGLGTTNYVPRWTSANNLSATGSIYDDGNLVGVGTIVPTSKLHIVSATGTSALRVVTGGGTNSLFVSNSGAIGVYTITPDVASSTNASPVSGERVRFNISDPGNATYSTVLLAESLNGNGSFGGHVAYFRRNLDSSNATSSIVTIEQTNRAGGGGAGSTLRVISGAGGLISQFQAISTGIFSMGATYSSGSSLLDINRDSTTLNDPGNADRWALRVRDSAPVLGVASNKFGVSIVLSGTYTPQTPGSQRLYGLYSDVSGVASATSTASVVSGAFLGGNVGVGIANPAARLHVSGTSMVQSLIIASGSSTGDLVRITQNGTGNSFVVEDSTNPDTTQFVIDTNGNVGIGLTAPAVKFHVTDSSRVTRIGTYSYLNLGVNSAFEAQYFTNSISAASTNISLIGSIRPMGLASNSLSINAGVVGTSYWDRDTSVSLGNANLLSSAPVLYGTIGQVIISATGGTVSAVAAVSGVVANQLAGVTVSNMFAFRAAWNNSSANNGYTGNYAAFYMPNETTNAPNIGNKYGIYIDDPNASNIFMGNMAIGTTTSATTSNYRLTVSGTVSTSGFVMSTGAVSGYVLTTDASGVGTWQVASGGGLTANNGLSYSNGIVGLGGSLVRPTLIANGNNSFTMSTTNVIEFLKNNGGVTFSYLLNNTGALHRATTTTGHNLLSVDDGSARIEVRDIVDGSSFSSIRIFNSGPQSSDDGSDVSTNNRMIVRDDYYQKGLIYAADYSAAFTNNSLVTKAYVTSVISTTGSGTTNYGARWVTSTQLGTGSIYDSGTAVGIATQSNGAYALNVLGDVNILGTLYATSKSFEITHPLDSTKRLTYGSLEGPEYGVYYRGRLNNESVINLPDYWSALVDENSISVNITPIGIYQRLFVDKIENNKVYIGSDNSGSPNCYYIVYAERKDIPKITVE